MVTMEMVEEVHHQHVQHVAPGLQPAIEEGQSDGHEQDQCRARQHPSRISGVQVASPNCSNVNQ
jgi:hypothetical protein